MGEPRRIHDTPIGRLAAILIVALVYFAAAWLGLSLADPASSKQVTIVWPPSGIALSALLLLSPRVWPAAALGAFSINVWTAWPHGPAIALGSAAGIALGNTLEAVLGAWMLRRWVGFDAALSRLRDVLGLALCGGALAPLVAATLGVMSLSLSGIHTWGAFGELWWTWWLGDALGVLIVAPLLLSWGSGLPRVRSADRGAEVFAFTATLGLVSYLILSGAVGDTRDVKYVAFPVFIWSALRLGQAVTSAGVALITTLFVLHSVGAEPLPVAADHFLMLMETFAATVSVTMLALGAVVIERENAERRRREAEQQLQLGLSTVGVGAWAWDIPGDSVTWTPEFERIHQMAPSAGRGARDDFHRTIHPDDRARVLAAIEGVARSGGEYAVEYRIVGRTGAPAWIEARGRLVRDAEGRPQGVIGVCSDITRRRRADEERAELLTRERAARQEAERAGELKDEFLATLSHELRTPLNSILGWAQLLGRGGLSGEAAAQAVETIDRNARLQSQLISDLLDMSAILSGKLRLDLRPIDLAMVIDAAIDSALPSAESKGVDIVRSVAAEIGPVLADPDRMQQVVGNLISNALKFTPERGLITIELRRGEGCAEVLVRDTGVGISAEFLPHVFDRFRQEDATSSRKHGGLGLGLAIVKHIVELHGGTVRAESAGEGHGATIVVSLPIARAARRRRSATDGHERPAHRLAGLRVLVVDDDADARALVARVVADRDAAVQTAASAAEALRIFEGWRPDVLISDIAMPDCDGYDLMQRVRRLERDRGGCVAAIALTAFVRPEDQARCEQAGYSRHLAKPVDPDDLIATIATVMDRRDS